MIQHLNYVLSRINDEDDVKRQVTNLGKKTAETRMIRKIKF